jgi:hypothetical protein
MASVAAALRARKERRENRCGAFMMNTSPILAFVVAGRFPFFPQVMDAGERLLYVHLRPS